MKNVKMPRLMRRRRAEARQSAKVMTETACRTAARPSITCCTYVCKIHVSDSMKRTGTEQLQLCLSRCLERWRCRLRYSNAAVTSTHELRKSSFSFSFSLLPPAPLNCLESTLFPFPSQIFGKAILSHATRPTCGRRLYLSKSPGLGRIP